MTAEHVFEHAGKRYSREDILSALREAGIRQGDTIFVHSDLTAFGKILPDVSREEYLDAFISALQEAVGEQGTLIMPTFSYSFCKKQQYDPATTPSTVGILTERFRKLPGVVRSNDPIFSAAAWGKDKEYFTTVGTDCFGANSVFEKLHERDALIVFLGPRFDITYMHFIEQRYEVPYRFIKNFSGTMITPGGPRELTVAYNVRPLDQDIDYDLERIAAFLDARGALKKTQLGHSIIRCVRAKDAFKHITEGFGQNIRLLLKEDSHG
jgi:aminoglycoside 3-N-acetyltransferase